MKPVSPKKSGRLKFNFLSPLLSTRDRIIALALLILWIGILLSNFILKGSYIFEGSLVVKEMGFTYNGDIPKLFVPSINSIDLLDIQGLQSEPLVLSGEFSTDIDPILNKKIDTIKHITINFNQSQSRLIVESLDSQIALGSLRIYPQTNTNQLTYNFSKNQLSFCLSKSDSSDQVPEPCLTPANFAPKELQAIADVTLNFSNQPLTLILDKVNIPELQINSKTNPQELTLKFIPERESQEKLLKLSSLAKLRILTKALAKDKPIDWFRGDIDVKNVHFEQFDLGGKTTDEIVNSTILKGEVRLEGNKLELQEQQFLIINDPQPGIRKIRSLQIYPEEPQGLRTFITGESRGIAVGLYPNFPVQSLKPSLLSKYLSQEAVNALLALLGAFTGIFLPRLFPEKAKNP
jgi:hypothetical protein